MGKALHSTFIGYLIAIAAIALAELARLMLGDLLENQAPLLLSTLAVVVAAWYGGLKPGLLATALSLLVAAFFFLEPIYSFTIARSADQLHTLLFAVVGVTISLVGELKHREHRRLEQALDEQHRVEAALREREEQFLFALNAANIFAWDCNLDTGFTVRSENVRPVLGIETGPAEDFLDKIHPEDRTRVEESIAKARRGEIPYDLEFRILTTEGNILWFQDKARLRTDPATGQTHLTGVLVDITRHKQIEAERLAAEEQLRLIMDTLPALISYVDRNGCYRLNNRAYESWFGHRRDEVTGRHVSEVLGDAAWEVIEPRLEQALAGHTVSYETEIPYQGAGPRWVSVIYTPHFDSTGDVAGVVALVNDLTERRRAEATLQQQAAQLRSQTQILDHANIMIRDFNDRIVLWSTGDERLYGWSKNEAVGRISHQLLKTRFSAPLNTLREQLLQTGQWEGELGHTRRDGSEIIVASQWILHRDEQGRPMAILEVNTDITARKQAESALREADRRKDEFLATLAHELRNPLAPIRNAVELLRLKSPPEPGLQWARDVIDRQVQQMTRLIDDLLDVSRITRNRLILRKEPVELATIVQNAVETSQPAIQAAGHTLTLDLPSEPIPLEADPVRLAQVFTNLLNNAAKFTERGGQITLRAERQDNKVVVTVKDTGIGIPAERLSSIFDMFVQIDKPPEQARGGLGIGLSLTRALVEMHGGRIEVHSAGLGQGSEFSVHLPLLTMPTPQALKPVDQMSDTPLCQTKCRILVVDDNEDAATSLALLLQMMGQDIQIAYDGLEALAKAETFRPQIVLLDLGMPKLNGYETARRLRAESWGEKAILVALTGWGQEEDRRRAREAGFDYHVVKPVDPIELEKLITGLSQAGGK
ncbi:MAG: PAS domain S-box protein [Candidatus Competibacteraceae bacterium]